MGAGTSAEEFFLKSVNVESIFEFVERTDYLFLYSIKECVEKSDCHEGVYLSEVAEYMKLSIPETSKMVKSLENKGYIIWKLDEKKERTYRFRKKAAFKQIKKNRRPDKGNIWYG